MKEAWHHSTASPLFANVAGEPLITSSYGIWKRIGGEQRVSAWCNKCELESKPLFNKIYSRNANVAGVRLITSRYGIWKRIGGEQRVSAWCNRVRSMYFVFACSDVIIKK